MVILMPIEFMTEWIETSRGMVIGLTEKLIIITMKWALETGYKSGNILHIKKP